MTKTVIELRCSELAKANRALLVKNNGLIQETEELASLLIEASKHLATLCNDGERSDKTIVLLKKSTESKSKTIMELQSKISKLKKKIKKLKK
tara:strand:- start:778 stop:1056 length:279 start_codon:yes stop_codon:yes gene_type:complete